MGNLLKLTQSSVKRGREWKEEGEGGEEERGCVQKVKVGGERKVRHIKCPA